MQYFHSVYTAICHLMNGVISQRTSCRLTHGRSRCLHSGRGARTISGVTDVPGVCTAKVELVQYLRTFFVFVQRPWSTHNIRGHGLSRCLHSESGARTISTDVLGVCTAAVGALIGVHMTDDGSMRSYQSR